MPDCCSDHTRVIRQIEHLDEKVDILVTDFAALQTQQSQIIPLVRGNGMPPLSERLARIEALQKDTIESQNSRHKSLVRALWALVTTVGCSLVVWIGPRVFDVVAVIWRAISETPPTP